jgi:predicted nucleotidyltransferase
VVFDWTNCPDPIHNQVSGLLEALDALLGRNLAGVYLHGSLAMGCFNPERSDLDLLVVSDRPVLRDTKLGLALTLLRRSRDPVPIELSVVARADLQPWRYPTPYQCHYSESWRERFVADTAGSGWLRWDDAERTDPDLAAHLTILHRRGVVLVGPSIAETLPEVPPADYLTSILGDVESAAGYVERDPVYAVLNLCRVYRYVVDGDICSKDEAGAWAAETLPEPLRPVAAAALANYRGARAPAWDAALLQRFVHELLGRIHALSAARPTAPAD